MDKTAALILYFVRRLRTVDRRTLMKLLYLADLEARRLCGRPITDLRYFWYKQGPFAKDFYERVEALTQAGLIDEKRPFCNVLGVEAAESAGFRRAEKAVADFILEKFGGMGWEELRRWVYQTGPMRAGERDRDLPMEQFNDEYKDLLGRLDPDSIARGIEDHKAGRSRKLEEVILELRGEARG